MQIHDKTNWLDLCFDLMEEYIPKVLEPYNEGNYIRGKFQEISNHAVTVAELFQSMRHDENEQDRVVGMFTDTAFGYSAMADYNVAMNLYKKSLKIIDELIGSEHPNIAATYNNIGVSTIIKVTTPRLWNGIKKLQTSMKKC